MQDANGQYDIQDPNRDLAMACRHECLEDVNKAILRGATDWNRGLYESCVAGQVAMAKLMFSHGANDIGPEGIRRICERGHLLVMQLLVQVFKMMKKNKTEEYKNALNVAVKYRRTALVQFLVAITRDHYSGMCYACLMGDELYLERLSSENNASTMSVYQHSYQHRNILYGMCRSAIEGGHLRMIKYIVQLPNRFDKLESLVDEKGYIRQVRTLLSDAYKNPNLDIVQYLESRCTELPEDRLNNACEGGHMAIIEHVVSSMEMETSEWEPACAVACAWGQLETAKWIATHATDVGVDVKEWDWGNILDASFSLSNVETLTWVLSQPIGMTLPALIVYISGAFGLACNHNRHHFVHYLLEHMEHMGYMESVHYDTLLSYACRNNNLDLAKHALRFTDNTVGNQTDIKSPMTHACDHMNVNMVKLLISHGSSTLIFDNNKYFIIALYANGIARKHFGADAERTLDAWQEKIKSNSSVHYTCPFCPCYWI